jgi:hypothetical protein
VYILFLCILILKLHLFTRIILVFLVTISLKKIFMENRIIVIEIIRQDMRFNQYIYALRKLGIEVYDFDLDLMSIVARLMNIEEEDITDAWMELYVKELSKSENVSIEALGKNLYPLAEACYKSLLNFNFNVSCGKEGYNGVTNI